MKPKTIIAVATLTTLCCIYLARLANEVDDSTRSESTSTAVYAFDSGVGDDEKFVSEVDLTNVKASFKTIDSVYTIQADIDNTFFGREGTGLFFPANCFVDRNGKKVKGKVKISLKECYDIPSILESKLSTTSDGRMLETAGMVDLQAKAGGKEVFIRDGMDYRIMFPRRDIPEDDFQLFYGEWKKDGIINWQLAGDGESEEVFYGTTRDTDSEEVAVSSDGVTQQVYRSVLTRGVSCFLHICESKLRRGTRISEMDYFNWQLANGQTLNQWFVANFNPDVQMLEEYCIQGLRTEITFKVNETGAFESYYISKSATAEYDRKIVDFLRTMPALNLKQLMPEYNYDHACILTFGSRQENEKQKFVSTFARKFEKDPDKPVADVKASELDYFIFSSSQLGWINCDRFYEDDQPLVDYVVKNEGGSASVSMVFDDLNSVLRGVNEGSNVVFRQVPFNRKVRLIGIQYPEEAPLMCVVKSNTKMREATLNSFQPFTIGELQAQFIGQN